MIVKLQNAKDKERILKAVREMTHHMQETTTNDNVFLIRNMETRRKKNYIFNTLKEKEIETNPYIDTLLLTNVHILLGVP